MIADKMKGMVAGSSAIRAMFEEGTRLASIYGAENVFDFSLGNPNVPAPSFIKQAILEILDSVPSVDVHGYTVAAGNPDAREALWLVYFENLSYEQAAAVMRLSVKKFEYRISKGRRLLKEELEREGITGAHG